MYSFINGTQGAVHFETELENKHNNLKLYVKQIAHAYPASFKHYDLSNFLDFHLPGLKVLKRNLTQN